MRTDRFHDADLRDLLGEQAVEHVRDQDRAEQQRGRAAGEQRQEQGIGLPLVGVCVGLGNLNLADRQTAFALQPGPDGARGGDHCVAIAARRRLPRVGDLDLQLVKDVLPPGQ